MSPEFAEFKRALRLGFCDIPKDQRNGLWKSLLYGMAATACAFGVGGLVTYLFMAF